MASLSYTLSDDVQTATLTFPTNPPVTVRLSAAEIEEMLWTLGDLRWQMLPEAPDSFQPDPNDQPVPDPAWETEADQTRENALLHLRDPRYGWLHYAMPKAEAAKLAGYLREISGG